ncbi:glycosyltransferase family 4 protein [uncultured Croceicoccus sp.]|uniref:glycosyltransferase family 4 protein n=1 Tax=uncultured Croceicoccus sp. TaxID=1295329 RepID=UPI00261AC5B0|nr:glycosyltransferase family 4 protein [uncultured Croceicoccus sp.]
MIRVVHLLDDFAMGGVTRALSMFSHPRIALHATSRTVAMGSTARDAAHLDADLIVIHVPPRWSRMPYLAALRLRNRHARIVQVEHSYTRALERNRVSSRRRFRLLIRLAARLVDEIVAVSHAQGEWLREVGVPRAKLTVIHPWSGRFDLFDIAETPPREGPLRLLSYGRFSPEKNYAALIEAVSSLSRHEATLTLFGDGPLAAELRARASRTDNVEILPACSDPAPFLEKCQAVILPSRFESFGLVATEARMAGRAIAVADIDGLPEQARCGGGLVRPMNDADEIAAAIAEFAYVDVEQMGREARNGVRAQHDRIIESWRALFHRAAR